MKEHFFENEYAEFWVESGILFKVYKPQVTFIDIKIAIASAEALTYMLRQCKERMPFLVETNKAYYMDRGASKLFSSHSNMNELKAIAVVMNNPAAILGGKLYVTIHKPKVKFNFFKDRNKALNWLSLYKNTN